MIEIDYVDLEEDQLILLYVSNPRTKNITIGRVHGPSSFKLFSESSVIYIRETICMQDNVFDQNRLLLVNTVSTMHLFKLTPEEEVLILMEFI